MPKREPPKPKPPSSEASDRPTPSAYPLGSRDRRPDRAKPPGEPVAGAEGGAAVAAEPRPTPMPDAAALDVERQAVRLRRFMLDPDRPGRSLLEHLSSEPGPPPETPGFRKTLSAWFTLVQRAITAQFTSAGRTAGAAKRRTDVLLASDPLADQPDPRTSLAGIALSGGGIRSATFSLGALQALGERGYLTLFDYLSTVSGGGFAGGWWSAFLSRRERDTDRRVFPDDERLEPDRFPAVLLDDANQPRGRPAHLPGTPDGSRSVAMRDPIHHVRLFANYLTPRRGALSGDTWRAITVISRNLILTWLILLPLLLAVTILAQLYFSGSRALGDGFACSVPDSVVVRPAAPADSSGIARAAIPDSSIPMRARSGACAGASSMTPLPSHRDVVVARLHAIAPPVTAFIILGIVLSVAWMLYGNGATGATAWGFIGAVVALTLLFGGGSGNGSWFGDRWRDFMTSRWAIVGLGGALVVFVWWICAPWIRNQWRAARRAASGATGVSARDVARDDVRSHIVRWHARVSIAAALILATLLVAGFGHEIIWYLFAPQSGVLAAKARTAGGWLALAITGGSSLFALFRAAPSSKAKDATPEPPGKFAGLVLAIAPVSLLLVLSIGFAGLGHFVIAHFSRPEAVTTPSAARALWALSVGVVLVNGFALYERSRIANVGGVAGESAAHRWMTVLFPTVVALAAYWFWMPGLLLTPLGASVLGSFSIALIAVRLRMLTVHGRRRSIPGTPPRPSWTAKHVLLTLAITAVLVWWQQGYSPVANPTDWIHRVAIAGLVFSILLTIIDVLPGGQDSGRALGLTGLASLMCLAEAMVHDLPRNDTSVALAAVGIGAASFLIAWTIGLGWMADPNLIGLHNFYKARIVRAYLGASNVAERTNREITESAPGDDVRLQELENHLRGAPVHVINTTLNLVGGQDLATAQRSAALFTMSSEVCGSARTGYHLTKDYMNGTLTLGAAVAASGAAVSANMGAKSVNASVALLLALFNVRLGFWAPTPSGPRWREAQPRLWPWYLLREALSQTNDLGTYCSLTDGGHFDNTGIYALVERGCQYIMALDDGADAHPNFSDMGEVVRRCRIDFGAEIEFDDAVDDYFPHKETGLVKVQVVRGRIRYAPAHLEMLGWSDDTIASRVDAALIWIKPGVTRRDSVDVRQYKLENREFPQQTTADQWYDEAQFESYRALAYQVVARRCEALHPTSRPVGIANIGAFFRDF